MGLYVCMSFDSRHVHMSPHVCMSHLGTQKARLWAGAAEREVQEGPMQPLSHSPPSPPATLVRLGSSGLSQDTAHPHLALLPESTPHTQAPSPGSGQE